MSKILPHALFGVPSLGDVQAFARAEGIGAEQAFMRLHRVRNLQIAKEKENPLVYGTEPSIWWICDCLLGFDWVDDEEAEAVRTALGFDRPVSTILINGGNRGGKSEYAAKRLQRLLHTVPDATGWAMDQNNKRSIENQQPLYWKFMAPEWRELNGVKSDVAYFKFTKKRGWTDARAVYPNGADLNFYSYQMDMDIVEGGKPDIINADEMVESDWVETMKARIAERMGRMIITFTPVSGYVDTVKMFQDGAKVVKESVNFLCPRDGGPPDVARFLGVSEEHKDEIQRWLENPKRYEQPSVFSVPEDCRKWLTGERSQPDMPEGREFKMAPRVMKCVDPEQAVVFFYSSDNPYGNPLSLWNKYANSNEDVIKMRMFGEASKMQTAMFPMFDERVHVVRAKDIPNSGTDYLIVDPCSGRNFFMAWFRATPSGVYIVKEWPNQVDDVPGVGVLGPWALPSGKKLDGKQGPAQESLGWGLAQYKQEIARVEGWEPYLQWVEGKTDLPEGKGMGQWIAEWPEWCQKRMDVRERFMDARFMNVKSFHRDGMETLADEFAEIGLSFYATSSDSRQSIYEGVQMVNDALYWNEAQPLSTLNRPKLYVSEECKNIIFGLSTWTGQDGQKGASKDPVDVVRYFFLKKLEYVDPQWTGFVAGRGCY